MRSLFSPNPEFARGLCEMVNAKLRDSLHYVLSEIAEPLGCAREHWEPWFERLPAHSAISPIIHGHYHELVNAYQADQEEQARAALRALLTNEPDAGFEGVITLSEKHLGASTVALFRRIADIEEENRLDLRAPERDRVDIFEPVYRDALDLLEENDPDLLGEYQALVRGIVLAEQGPSGRFPFGAVSCFELWGALLLNPTSRNSPLELVGTLAHEATHALLFAMAVDEPLVLNSSEERFYSPLREQNRTMDGIYHATIVSARMARAFRFQAAGLHLSENDRRAATVLADSAHDYFDLGVAAIRKDGRLSSLGETLLVQAQDAVTLSR